VIGTDNLESAWTYVWRDTKGLSSINIDMRPTFYTIDGDTMEIVAISSSASESLIQSLIDG